jgi:predicted acyl esterase
MRITFRPAALLLFAALLANGQSNSDIPTIFTLTHTADDYVKREVMIPMRDGVKLYTHVTDAYDTIDWLVKNVAESNGRVGMIGSSYEGFTVVMALLGAHPALKVAAPESPMVDGWMGDDWFHYGAFRQTNFDYTMSQTAQKVSGHPVKRDAYDDYDAFRRAFGGSICPVKRSRTAWLGAENDRASRI